jgi:hypothetical protein
MVIMMNGGPIAWESHKQDCTASSTTEEKYIAAMITSQELRWLRQLLADLTFDQPGPTTLFCDNQATIRLVRNPEFHKRTKHINIKYHIICENEARGFIRITYIPTADNVADIMTKRLPRDRFSRQRMLMGLTESEVTDNTAPPTSSRVGV